MINLSLEFDRRVVASEIPEILSAIRFAHGRGAVIVAAAGNTGQKSCAGSPTRRARGDVIAVGATTRNGCRSDYSSSGADLDVVAPGGGVDAEPATPEEAAPLPPRDGRATGSTSRPSRGGSVRRFGLPRRLRGHVDGEPARGRASRRWSSPPASSATTPTPDAVQAHIQATARDLGRPGFDSRYGWGLVDAARALRCPPFTPAS